MTSPIEDYAMLGDGRSAALVSRGGSVDWLCMPRLDSEAAFAALLGTPDHGRWLIEPSELAQSSRRYEPGTMVLETTFETSSGRAKVLDFIPISPARSSLVRMVIGVHGAMRFETEILLRPDYGRTIPWVERTETTTWRMIAGAHLYVLRAPIELHGEDHRTVGLFNVRKGDVLAFDLTHGASHEALPTPIDAMQALEDTRAHWLRFSRRQKTPEGCPPEWTSAINRSLITLKALTYAPTGGITAAATTSLPEAIGGSRNWDYRYCWLRDASFTLSAFLSCGYGDEADAWRNWLVRAVAGSPDQIQIMYGLAGERTLTEWIVPWLPGYESSAPVRVGNTAAQQLQHDIFGEVADAMYRARADGLQRHPREAALRRSALAYLESHWNEPDEGIWEVRSERKHFTHSKVLAWVAFDRAARAMDAAGDQDAERWRRVADGIHADVCRRGFNRTMGCFVQSYGSDALDASLLLIPLMGFLPFHDERVVRTVQVIEDRLSVDGLLLRYDTGGGGDGLPPGEGVFLACSFWLVEVYVGMGRVADARTLFKRLLTLCNDVGLLAEEYDTTSGRMLGNFPQAFSHVGLVNAALALIAADANGSSKQPLSAVDPLFQD